MKEKREDSLSLSKEVVEKLKERGLYLTAVESCTGGGLANSLTNVAGASEVMKESFITYSNEAKMALGVPKEIIEKYSVYSLETAEAMAEAGLKRAVRADLAIGVTGSLSRVDPKNQEFSLPGEVFFALKFKDGKTITKKINLAEGERWQLKEEIIVQILKTILENLK
ncbi:MAG: nicotinamide-nucleotide amidohydrolase family protein [Patescibacteria group bacterium]|nr:nicotinamide-nucleotide amidohydrolase family protein [Patescibacteria group bacterium]